MNYEPSQNDEIANPFSRKYSEAFQRLDTSKNQVIYHPDVLLGKSRLKFVEIIGTVEGVNPVLRGSKKFYNIGTIPIFIPEGTNNGNGDEMKRFGLRVSRGENGLVKIIKPGNRFRGKFIDGRALNFELL